MKHYLAIALAAAALALASYAALKPAPAVGDTSAVTYAIQYVKDLAVSQGAIVENVKILAVREHGNTAIVKETITFHQPGLTSQALTISVTLLRGVWVERYAKLTD